MESPLIPQDEHRMNFSSERPIDEICPHHCHHHIDTHTLANMHVDVPNTNELAYNDQCRKSPSDAQMYAKMQPSANQPQKLNSKTSENVNVSSIDQIMSYLGGEGQLANVFRVRAGLWYRSSQEKCLVKRRESCCRISKMF